MENKTLKQRILEEMSVSYVNSLEKNFELAKKFIRITPEGNIDIIMKDKLTGKDQILLYLIGKMYAREAEKSVDIDVKNQELANELGIPIGSLLPWLKDLRASNKIKPLKKDRYVSHYIPVNLIEKVLNDVDNKMRKKMISHDQ